MYSNISSLFYLFIVIINKNKQINNKEINTKFIANKQINKYIDKATNKQTNINK